MKDVLYQEEGVASAVGTIFAILIFVSLLSIFVSTYVPATMMADEEQYSSTMMNSMVQLASSISQMSLNYRSGEVALIPFDLESSYVPIFSSPTYGYINVSSNGPSQEGYLTIEIFKNGTPQGPIISAGGAIMAFTDNRYFTDEAWSYEFSSLFYFNPSTKDQGSSSLISNLVHVNPNVNGLNNISLYLVNIVGGPNTISTSSPVAISVNTLNEQTFSLSGNNITLKYDSFILQKSIQNSLNQSLSFNKAFTFNGNSSAFYISSLNPFSIYITEITIIVGMSSYNS